MNQKTIDNHIRYCLFLANCGIGSVSPNPPVGSILVYNDQIIGEGFHKKFGEAHAEVNAIENVPDVKKQNIPDACLFVSLEPCLHSGKTGPCAELILKNKIKKLVFGCYDPNPLMSGKSIRYLKDHGVNVIGPVLEKECQETIREFSVNIRHQRPYIILKFAQSADFFISKKNQSTKISSEISDILVHQWRSQIDAILVGKNTILLDNPQLTNRKWPGKNPHRIALAHLNELNTNELNIFNKDAISWTTDDILPNTPFDLTSYVKSLYKKQIGILMVEGGAKTIQSFYTAGLWDEARVITNPEFYLKDGIAAPSIEGILAKKIILEKDIIHYISKYQ